VRALLFDFDGTLVDTESTVLASWHHLYDASGHELELSRWLETVGGDVDARYDALAELVGDGFDRESAHALRREHELSLVGALPLRDGLSDVLDRAADRGLVVAVVSSSPAYWVHGHLVRLGLLERFAFTVTREDAERAKPHPDLYLAALDRLGLPPQDVLVVEDSVNGVAAAHAAGLSAVAVPNAVTQDQPHAVTVLETVALWSHLEQLLASRSSEHPQEPGPVDPPKTSAAGGAAATSGRGPATDRW